MRPFNPAVIQCAEPAIETAWDEIALHTTPRVTQYKKPEVALLLFRGRARCLGEGYHTSAGSP